MLKSSFEGKVTTTKKKGQLYVISVKTGRDIIKCLTSVDITKHGIEKDSSLYIEGYYSITNALFPITNLYKIVNGNKIVVNIEEKHFYEQIEAMPPMTKKKKGKDGTFDVPETLTRDTEEEKPRIKAETFGINFPSLDPDSLVSKTKPVSKPKVKKPKVEEKGEKVVDEKTSDAEITLPVSETEEKISTETEIKEAPVSVEESTDAEITETSGTDSEVETENLFDINIPDIMAELEDEEAPISVVEESTDAEIMETPETDTENKTTDTIIVEDKPQITKPTIQFDDDFGLPIPTFGKTVEKTVSKQSVPVQENKVFEKKEPIIEKKEKSIPVKVVQPKQTEKPIVAQTKKEETPVNNEVKVQNGKFPVKFSSADLM